MASKKLSTIVGGGASVYPTLKAKDLGAAAFKGYNNGVSFEGFLGDGDYIRLPLTATGLIEYFNNADASQFTVTKANVNAAVDNWVGFMFDAAAGLLYGIAADTGTAPDTYYTFSVNSAGTIVNIGNAQIGTDFASAPIFSTTAITTGSGSIWRTAEATGNLFIRVTISGGFQEAEVNITTGAFVTAPSAPVNIFAPSALSCPYKTANSVYLGTMQASATADVITLDVGSSPDAASNIIVQQGLGIGGGATGLRALQWKGYIALCTHSNSIVKGPRFYEVSDFETWVEGTSLAAGVS